MDDQTTMQLEAYLDNLLEPAERAAFERRVQVGPDLQAALGQQRLIDESLRRAMALPATAPALTLKSHDLTSAPASLRLASPWLRRLALAAVVMAGMFGTWSIWNSLRPSRPEIPPR